ncbi:MAG: YdcF family protein [Pyrinomonadaceae bacterium]
MKKAKSEKISRKGFKFLCASLLLFIVWIFLAPFLAERLIVEKPLQRADAILVLGGSSTYLERTSKAAEVYKKGVAPKIFLTDDGKKGGWNKQEQRNPFFVELARSELIKQGVAEDAIEILPGIVEGTQDEAILLEKTARERNLKSVLLVTSSYHTRRALRTFEKVLQNNNDSVEIGIESPPTGWQTSNPSYWWFSARGWNFVAGEYLKTVYYWLFY